MSSRNKKNNLSSKEKIEMFKEQPYIGSKCTNLEKTLTTTVFHEIHMGLKMISFKYRTSMSQILREFVEQVVFGDKHLLNIIKRMKDRDNEEYYKEIINFESDRIYELLEEFENEKKEDGKKEKEEVIKNDNDDDKFYDIFDNFGKQ